MKHGIYFNEGTQVWECWWNGALRWSVTAEMWELMRDR